MLNKEKAVEAFDDYMKVAFPWVETQKKRDKQGHINLLLDEVKKGSLGVRALWEKPMRSRMKTRVVEREPANTRDDQAQNALYAKLGMMVPLK